MAVDHFGREPTLDIKQPADGVAAVVARHELNAAAWTPDKGVDSRLARRVGIGETNAVTSPQD